MKVLKNCLGMLTVLLVTLSLAGCGSSSTKKSSASGDDEANMGQSDAESILEKFGDSDSNKAGGISSVYFDFNSSALSDEARETLASNAEFLQENSPVEVQIEGHCDERGGIQYNIALGEKRANVVKDFLVASGVSSDRITTISYGKERPVVFGHNDSAWSKNRRGNFVITAK